MSTNLEIITRALQELGVIAIGTSASAQQGELALDYLNMLMAEYDVSDTGVGFAPQDTLSDTCPIPTWSENAIVALLAGNLSSPMRTPLSATLTGRIASARNTLIRTNINKRMENADMSHISSGQADSSDILNG